MSPRTGLFSNDVWTLVAIFVRNILLNWMVLIPLLMAVLMVPRLYLATLSLPERLYPQILAGEPAGLGEPGARRGERIGSSAAVARAERRAAGHRLFFTLLYLPSVGGRDHSRYDFSLQVLAPLVGAVLTFLAFDSLYYLGRNYVIESQLLLIVHVDAVPVRRGLAAVLVVRRGSMRDRLRCCPGRCRWRRGDGRWHGRRDLGRHQLPAVDARIPQVDPGPAMSPWVHRWCSSASSWGRCSSWASRANT